MDMKFQTGRPGQWQGDVLLLLACEAEQVAAQGPWLDEAAPWLASSPAWADFGGKADELAWLYAPQGSALPRVLAVGLGPRDKVDAEKVRRAVAQAIKACRRPNVAQVLLPVPQLAHLPGGQDRLLEECAFAARLALYRFDSLKKQDKDEPAAPASLTLAVDGETMGDGPQAAVKRGVNAAAAVALARDLANTPGNLLNPATLAGRASELAGQKGLRCTVIEGEALANVGMGGIVAVGQGSAHAPCLVVLEHAPAGHEQDKPLLLVGKGITFDSGGISIKPSSNMHQMKCDMSGAAAVLATLCALADEACPRRVIGLLPCAENMPGGAATRPGDVVRVANGDTVEIVNTDAEGRMVLCDALVHAQKEWTPAAVVDIATLTGACAVALGTGLAGLFCDDDDLAGRITASGHVGGEHYWRLPLWQPYAEKLKSPVADICHTGSSREGGAITAALFLQHFVHEGTRWAHLDIAGVDWNNSANALCPEGATGFGARTLLELARGGV